MKWQFQEDHSFEHRVSESQKIRSRYPDRIPVIVERAENSNIENIDKRKYLVPNDITVAQFMWIIRKRKYISQRKHVDLHLLTGGFCMNIKTTIGA